MMGVFSSVSSSLPRARITLHEPVDPAELVRGTPIVRAVFASGPAFLEAFEPERAAAGELAVVWRRFGATTHSSGMAEDLSAGGVLISTREGPPPVGEQVGLRLMAASAAQDLVVTGRVQHVRSRGEDAAFGVCFKYRSSGE